MYRIEVLLPLKIKGNNQSLYFSDKMSLFRINSICSRYVANSFILNTLDTQTSKYIRFLYRKSSKTSITSYKLNQRTFFTSAYFCEKEVTADVAPVKKSKHDKYKDNQLKKRRSRMSEYLFYFYFVFPEDWK